MAMLKYADADVVNSVNVRDADRLKINLVQYLKESRLEIWDSLSTQSELRDIFHRQGVVKAIAEIIELLEADPARSAGSY